MKKEYTFDVTVHVLLDQYDEDTREFPKTLSDPLKKSIVYMLSESRETNGIFSDVVQDGVDGFDFTDFWVTL